MEKQVKDKTKPALVSVENAGRYLAVSRGHMYRLLERGEIPYYNFNGVMKVAWSDVDDYMKQHLKLGRRYMRTPRGGGKE